MLYYAKLCQRVLLVMLNKALVVAFAIPKSIVAFTGLKSWSRKALYTKIDLCTQPCYSQILPGLYLSNAKAAADRSVLQRLGITHVLTVELHPLPKTTLSGYDVTTLFIKANDTCDTQLMPYFPMANAFIEEGIQSGQVLVHCRFGVSRSATLVIAYLMERYRLTFDQAYAFVKKRRHFINPNPGFVAQLKEYQRQNYYVSGFHRLEAYVNANSGAKKYKVVSIAALLVGIMIPVLLLLG